MKRWPIFRVLCEVDPNSSDLTNLSNERALAKVQSLTTAKVGSELMLPNGTAWGLLNAVTEYVDHERRARSPSTASLAWFGQGAAIKQRALDTALNWWRSSLQLPHDFPFDSPVR